LAQALMRVGTTAHPAAKRFLTVSRSSAMASASIFVLLSLLLAPLSVSEPTEASVPDAAFVADDECMAGDDPAACALNAVQLRASQAQQEGAAVAKWYLGQVGASCSATCSAQRMSCSAADFKSVTGWQQLFGAAQQAGAQCKYSWANDGRHGEGFYNVPAVCTLAKCGADMQGTCAYDVSPRSTCEGVPATGFSRLCPCAGSASASLWPAPAPAPAMPSSPSLPSSHGFHPSPAPAPMPASHGSHAAATCKAETGGTCKLMGCAASRGGNKAVVCDKKAGYKCLCKTGFCADKKGACVAASR